MIKERIKQLLFNKSEKINSQRSSKLKEIDPELFKEIHEKTSFITEDNLCKRIYLILNDLTSEPVCKKCGVKTSFKTYTLGYKDYCGNPKCYGTVVGKSCSGTKLKQNETIRQDFIDSYTNKSFAKKTDEEILAFILDRCNRTEYGFKSNLVNIRGLLNYKDLLCNVLDKTDKDIQNTSYWAERFYNILYPEKTKFCGCGNIKGFNNIKKGYSEVCSSIECRNNLSSSNKRQNHFNNTIVPCVEAQGFQILNKEIMEDKGINHERIQLKCNKCQAVIDKDMSCGRSINIYCEGCYGKNGISREEDIFVNEIVSMFNEKYETQVEFDKYKNGKKTYDLFFPEFKLAIDYHGIFYHSGTDLREKYRHKIRSDISEKKDIVYLQVFSNEWLEKKDKWLNIIKNKLNKNETRLFARKCYIKEITIEEKNEFLREHHFQGEDKSQIKLGLFYKEELVSAMTFGKPRFNKQVEWELLRYCSKSGVTVVGGASKLFKFFENQYSPKSVVSYCDRRRGNGNFYKKLGLEFSKNTEPNYFYFKHSKFLTRYQCQKHKLQKILEKYDESKTEYENMFENGFRIVFDAGNSVFYKKYK